MSKHYYNTDKRKSQSNIKYDVEKRKKSKNKLKKQLKIKNCNGRINKEKYEGGKKKMNKKLKIKQEKGITLIALVVTIVVLLILAGVSISLVLNNNGVINLYLLLQVLTKQLSLQPKQ